MLFPHPRTHMGGGCNPPCHFAPNWDRTVGQRPNESLRWSESNSTRVDLFRSYLDPSRSGERKNDGDLRINSFSQINFKLRKTAEWFKHHRVSLFKTHRNIYFLTSEGQVKNLTSGQSNMMIDLSWPWHWSWPWYNVWSHFLIQGSWSLQSTASVLYQTRNQHRIR